ncbi:MAG TPA: DUF305 domain-containing protein [Chitinophagaceae bacterium]
MRYFIIFSIALSISACNSGSNTSENQTDTANHANHNTADNAAGGQNHMKAMHDAMNNNMQQMHSMKSSGDPDYDFAMMMKHHHQGAIDMAKIEVAGGTDAQLKQIAQKTIDEQQKENSQFNEFIKGNQPTGNSDYVQKALGMMTPMSDIKMESGSLDAMFASMMIPHHQDAVKMAQEYLQTAKNENLKRIAQNIVSSQPKEIQELQSWLKKQK